MNGLKIVQLLIQPWSTFCTRELTHRFLMQRGQLDGEMPTKPVSQCSSKQPQDLTLKMSIDWQRGNRVLCGHSCRSFVCLTIDWQTTSKSEQQSIITVWCKCAVRKHSGTSCCWTLKREKINNADQSYFLEITNKMREIFRVLKFDIIRQNSLSF